MEGEINLNYFVNVTNNEDNLDIVISETVNGEDHVNTIRTPDGVYFPATEIENADCEALDLSSTGSTGCIRLGVEGETQYNPIDVTAAADSDNG